MSFYREVKKSTLGIIIEERSTALNMGIGRNVGLTPKLQHKNKSRQWSGADQIHQ